MRAYVHLDPEQIGGGAYGYYAGQLDEVRVYNRALSASEVAAIASVGAGGASVPRDGHAQLSYDEATNRINSAGWEYDAAGNQTRIQIAGGSWQRLEYDAAGRLVRVRDDAGSVLASYTYGATNERLISQEGDVRTYYAWSGSAVITEYTEVSTSTQPIWSKHYVYLGARLLATLQPSGGGSERVEYHHPDRLGTRLVTNNQDGSYYEQVTLPFGVALDAESTGATNRRFTSYDRSAVTGLDYAINRHYDPLQGRFTQVDPIGMDSVDLTDPQTLNLYAYCANDPVNQIDPDGLFFKKLFRWIGKALKWAAVGLLVAAAVATTLIVAAPVGSVLWKVGSWLLTKALPTAAKYLSYVGVSLPPGLGMPGTPPWNPEARGFGFSWQDQSGCGVGSGNPICTVTVTAPAASVSPLARVVAKILPVVWGGIKAGGSWLWRGARKAGSWIGDKAKGGWRLAKNRWYRGMSRPLTPDDLGVKGTIEELRGTLTVGKDQVTVRIDMIRGEIHNPFEVFRNLSDVARGYGATTLRIEGTIANERLYGILQRYGLRTSGATDYIIVPLR